MLPEIATLKEWMSKGGDWMKFRREIATLHDKANTQAEFVELMEPFAGNMTTKLWFQIMVV